MKTNRHRLDKVSLLKIDKDCYVDGPWIRDYVRVIRTICQSKSVRVASVRMCRSAHKGLHFYIAIDPPVRAELANRLQWLLGDDCYRVDFNRARIRCGFNKWNKLFEIPGTRLTRIYRGMVPTGTLLNAKGGVC